MVSAKLIIAEPAMMRKTMEASDSCGISRSNLLAFDVNDECLYDLYDDICSWRSLLEYGESEFETCEEEGAVASYKTSSGTTGLPKAVMIPHEYLIEQARLKADATNINYEVSIQIPYCQKGVDTDHGCRSDASLLSHPCTPSLPL